MIYRIKSMTHTGAKGEAGTEREEEYYTARNGVLVNVNFDNWHVGSRIHMRYIVPSDNPLSGKMMVTSMAEEINKKGNGDVEIVTLNTVYYLEKAGAQSVDLEELNRRFE